jgi:hypothetical protein
MFRPVLTLAAFGVAGYVAFQLLWGLVLPLVFGLFAIALKIAFWVIIISAGIWVIKRITRSSSSPETV